MLCLCPKVSFLLIDHRLCFEDSSCKMLHKLAFVIVAASKKANSHRGESELHMAPLRRTIRCNLAPSEASLSPGSIPGNAFIAAAISHLTKHTCLHGAICVQSLQRSSWNVARSQWGLSGVIKMGPCGEHLALSFGEHHQKKVILDCRWRRMCEEHCCCCPFILTPQSRWTCSSRTLSTNKHILVCRDPTLCKVFECPITLLKLGKKQN